MRRIRIEWQDFSSWEPWIAEQVMPSLRKGALGRWRMRAQELRNECLDGDVWLDDLLASEAIWTTEELVETLSCFYGVESVIAIHGTRITDPSVVHRTGLAPASWSRRGIALEQMLAARGLNAVQAAVLRGEFDKRRSHDEDIDTGKWFAALDLRLLVRESGHYLLLGSEWLAGLMCKCGVLWKAEGYPTVFYVAVPIRSIPEYATDALAKELLREWVRLKALQRRTVRLLDYALIVRTHLPAKNVLRHYHPSRIVDPHRRFKSVRVSQTHCPACTAAMPTKRSPRRLRSDSEGTYSSHKSM